MSNDETSIGGLQRALINVSNDADVHMWAQKLDVSPEQIKEAAQAVGNQADKVELYLKGTRSTTNSDITERAHDTTTGDNATQNPSKSDEKGSDDDANAMPKKKSKLENNEFLITSKIKEFVSSFSASTGESFQQKSKLVQNKAREAAEYAIDYTKAEPVKAVLIAAAAGALIAGIVITVTRPRN